MDKLLMTCATLFAVDGDTVKCDGENMRILGDGAPYVSGVDTPEIGRWADCLAEDKLGTVAKVRANELLGQPGVVIENSGEVDRWKRPLVAVRLPNGATLGGTLLAEGHAQEWRPGARTDWCD